MDGDGERAKGELYPWKHEERVMEEGMRGERVMQFETELEKWQNGGAAVAASPSVSVSPMLTEIHNLFFLNKQAMYNTFFVFKYLPL